MKDSPKEYAEELLEFFTPTDISDRKVALSNAKVFALFHIRELYKLGDAFGIREPLMYFNAVEKEIKKYGISN